MTAWTAPTNVVTATPVSSATHNSEVLDNLRHMKEWDWNATNGDAGAHAAGDVVVQDTGATNTVELCTSAGQGGRVGVARAAVAAGATGHYATFGHATVKVQGTVAIGDALQCSATAGRAQTGSTNAFAIAQSANASGAGTVVAVIAPVGGTGTVTSVALTVPAEFSVAGSPVTTSGTLAVSKANQSANLLYAGPASGAAAAPTFRAAVPLDLAAAPPNGGRLAVNNGGALIWTTGSNTSAFRAYRSANQTHASSGSFVKIQYETEAADILGEYDNATNYQFTAAVAGLYLFSASVLGQSVPLNTRLALDLYLGGVQHAKMQDYTTGPVDDYVVASSIIVALAASDTVDIRLFQDSGGSLTLLGGAAFTYFRGVRLL